VSLWALDSLDLYVQGLSGREARVVLFFAAVAHFLSFRRNLNLESPVHVLGIDDTPSFRLTRRCIALKTVKPNSGDGPKQQKSIAKEIGSSVYKDCRDRNFSRKEAQTWKQVFEQAFST
jgi:hypothetical protein